MKHRQTAAVVMGIIGVLCILYSVVASLFLLLSPDGEIRMILFDINIMIAAAAVGILSFVIFMILNSKSNRGESAPRD